MRSPSESRKNMRKWLVVAFLTLCLFLLNFLNSAPASSLPLLPELAILSICLFFVADCVKTKNSCSKSALAARIWISPIVLVALTFIRAVMSHLEIQRQDPLCSVQPGLTQMLECWFQAGIDQNASPRMALYLLTSVCIFTTSYRNSKRLEQSIIPYCMLAAGFLFISITIILHLTQTSIPGYVIGQVYAASRLSILMENPTWIWPLLTPASIGLIYLNIRTPSVLKKIIFSAFGMGFSVFLIRTQQRGAIVAAFWILFWLGAPAGLNLIKKAKAPILMSIVGACALVYIASFPQRVTQYIASFLSYTALSDRLLNEGLASSRTDMWNLALRSLEGHWLFGFGHGAWYREFSKRAVPVGIEAYDTAHNFFIQTLFELGIIQLALILATGLIITAAALKRSWQTDRTIFWTLLHGLGLWILALSVQEIDFVRSVFYFNSLCAGWIFSCSFQQENSPTHVDQTTQECSWTKWNIRASALILAGLTLFLATKFTLGGYQYEAHYRSQYHQKVRWLRSKGTLGFFLNWDTGLPVYALYRVLASSSTEIEFKLPQSNWQLRNLSADIESYVPVKDQLWYEPPMIFKTPHHFVDHSRYLSVLLQWPPLISTIPITQGEGLLDWEKSPFDGLQIRWCGKDCRIQVLGCSRSQDRILTLMAARPDIDITDPLSILVSASQESYRIIFTEPNQTKEIKVPYDGNITLLSNRTYSTKDDPRLKAILLLKSVCQTSNTSS